MEQFSTLLFPILTTLNNGQAHWYLIVVDIGKPVVITIWDSIWQSCRAKDKLWDKSLCR